MRTVAALLLAGLSACAWDRPVGRDFDLDRVQDLRPGVTTRTDAERLFGRPDHTLQAGDLRASDLTEGERLFWRYGTMREYFPPGGARVKYEKLLLLDFGADGRLTRVTTFRPKEPTPPQASPGAPSADPSR